jgi:CheY-like chemotaxis protein
VGSRRGILHPDLDVSSECDLERGECRTHVARCLLNPRGTMRPKVLVIEANDKDAGSFVSALSAAIVELETDANAAVAKLGRGDQYDLVVCDLAARSDLSAQFSEALRKLSGVEGTLLAVISDDPQEAEAYSNAGICVLARPVRTDDLRALLDSASEASAASDVLRV